MQGCYQKCSSTGSIVTSLALHALHMVEFCGLLQKAEQKRSAPTQPMVGIPTGAIHFWNSLSQWACDMPIRDSEKSSGNAAIAGTSSISFHAPCMCRCAPS